MDALGIARTPEGFQQFQGLKNSGSQDVQDMLARIELQMAEFEMQREQREYESERLSQQGATSTAANNLVEIDRINSEIMDITGGEPVTEFIFGTGSVVPATWQNWFASAGGLQDPKLKRLAELMQDFDRRDADLAFDRIATGTPSNSLAMFQNLTSTKASRDLMGPVNEGAIYDQMQAILLNPYLEDETRERIEAAMRRIEIRRRKRAEARPSWSPTNPPPFTPEQLRNESQRRAQEEAERRAQEDANR
jgi:hypothetical protein